MKFTSPTNKLTNGCKKRLNSIIQDKKIEVSHTNCLPNQMAFKTRIFYFPLHSTGQIITAFVLLITRRRIISYFLEQETHVA
uniref:Uncharacterized protein n=1 Tax=Solanum tuberosum TaxID=4113 RepID=M1D6P9_SOLTU